MSIRRMHFVGVSGIGVSALARLSLHEGLKVSGSSDVANEITDSLSRHGMKFFLGHDAGHVDEADAVVRSAAVPDDNPEVLAAKKKGIPLYLYSEYLGMLMARKRGIAVAGTHGKTTTTALLGTIFSLAGLEPTIVCGGIMQNFSSNAVHGKGAFFIAEACEYNRSFHDLPKECAVVTNIEADHLDYYRSIDEIKQAFLHFIETVAEGGFSVVNGDDVNVKNLLSSIKGRSSCAVGSGQENEFRIADVASEGGFYRCAVTHDGASPAALSKNDALEIKLGVPGAFNCMNASLAAVTALKLGIKKGAIEEGIRKFRGAERRMESIGSVEGNPVYSDYAHHPTEIRAALGSLRELFPSKKVILVFQPHQYSRTIELFEDFVDALALPDLLILMEIYRQRDSEPYVNRVGGVDLYNALIKNGARSCVFVKERTGVIPALEELRPRDCIIVFMGAGDIDEIARRYAVAFTEGK